MDLKKTKTCPCMNALSCRLTCLRRLPPSRSTEAAGGRRSWRRAPTRGRGRETFQGLRGLFCLLHICQRRVGRSRCGGWEEGVAAGKIPASGGRGQRSTFQPRTEQLDPKNFLTCMHMLHASVHVAPWWQAADGGPLRRHSEK